MNIITPDLEDCQQITTCTENTKTTKFIRDGECVAERQIINRGRYQSELWTRNHVGHRRLLPAVIHTYDGELWHMSWYSHGARKRGGGLPNFVEIIGGRMHREYDDLTRDETVIHSALPS